MLFKKKRRQDLPVDREWKEKNQEYIMELERFLDRTDSIKDEQLRREIIARMLICDKVLTELAEQKFLEKYNEGYKKGKNDIIYITTQHCGVEKWIMQRLAFLITAFGNC